MRSSFVLVGLKYIIFPGSISERCKYAIEGTGCTTAEISRQPIGSRSNSQGYSARYISVHEWCSCNKVLCILSGEEGVVISLVALLDFQRWESEQQSSTSSRFSEDICSLSKREILHFQALHRSRRWTCSIAAKVATYQTHGIIKWYLVLVRLVYTWRILWNACRSRFVWIDRCVGLPWYSNCRDIIDTRLKSSFVLATLFQFVWHQLVSPSILLIRKTDVLAHWSANTDLTPLATMDQKWRKLNVLGTLRYNLFLMH